MSETAKNGGGGHYTCFGGKLLNMITTPVLVIQQKRQGSMCYFNVLFQCVTSTKMGLFSTIFQIVFIYTDLERK